MTKNEFAKWTSDKLIYLDGATGSNLVKAGMPSGVCPEQWILEHPDIMQHGERECPLPLGCAFKVQKISYFHIYRIYIVRIKKL